MGAAYTCVIRRSQRKTLALRVVSPGEIEVRAPLHTPAAQIDAFLRQNARWIDRHLQRARQRAAERAALTPFSEEELRVLTQRTAQLLSPRIQEFSRQLGVTYQRVTVRRQRTRWGSCSAKGNLNFNCLLALCPPDVMDYVVVHELCHRKEMNHSPRFWALVQGVLPGCARQRAWLKTEGQVLIDRLKISGPF